MLEKDEDFWRKAVGIMGASGVQLSIRIVGTSINFYTGDRQIASMGGATFYRMSVDEILETIGVPNDGNKKRYNHL